MSFLTIDQLDDRTKIDFVKNESVALKTIWLDAANGYLESLALDSSKSGFNSAMQYIAQNIVESMASGNQEASILAANNPFRQEKIGSYSYTLKNNYDIAGGSGSTSNDNIHSFLTPIAAAMLQQFRINSKKMQTNTTSVFENQDHPNIVGFR